MIAAPTQNLLLQEVEYQFEATSFGTWRRFVYPSGELFEEFTSHRRFGEMPLLHYTRGKCPETGKRIVARGVIAIGRLAKGYIAIGQASMGLIAIGQLAVGLLFGFGQASTGIVSIGQLALAMGLAVGQFSLGYAAIGQFALGTYALGQLTWGDHVWNEAVIDPAARRFFLSLIGR